MKTILKEKHKGKYKLSKTSGEQYKTPYFDVVANYVDSNVLTFHCPGHQQGKGAHETFRDFLGDNAFKSDITQVYGMDDLHQPTGVIKEAQRLAATAYDSDDTYFLINGSSSGNQAMILTVCNPQDEIIIPRNAHRSVIGALILSGAVPIYVQPEYDEAMRVDHTLTPEAIEKAIKEHPNAKAVLIVSPTYYGACADLSTIVDVVHKYNKAVLVDEAWGAHLHFHPDLPMSAMAAGADMCVNSTHKLISGLSQSSMLHTKGNKIDKGRLQGILRMLLSSSPNSLLISSLDVARMQMATQGYILLSNAIKLAELARKKINRISGFKAYGKEIVGRPGVFDFDVTRLVFTGIDIGFAGYGIERILRHRYNVQIELSDLFTAIALITIAHNRKDIEKLVLALQDIAKNGTRAFDQDELFHKKVSKPVILPDYPAQVTSPREAFISEYKTIPFKESANKICAELVTPYPPGIPVLCPGERITQGIIDYMQIELEAGIHIQGAVDATLENIRVVK